ncbi:MAG: hypothetical protein LUF78_06715 [Clostridiales bacterium]|nr:hypothetical protein [Clostridiales bacterium]
MILHFMDNNGICTIINADFKNEQVTIENKTDDNLHRAFGVNETPSWADFEFFLEDRCFPRTRDKLKLVLKDIGVDHYDPLTIIRKTQGRMAEDTQWIEIISE